MIIVVAIEVAAGYVRVGVSQKKRRVLGSDRYTKNV
jgi:hypothetical protein